MTIYSYVDLVNANKLLLIIKMRDYRGRGLCELKTQGKMQ